MRLENVTISKPIEQTFNGSQGVFHQLNVESRKKFTIKEFKAYTEQGKPRGRDSRPHRQRQDSNDSGETLATISSPSTDYEKLERMYWRVLPCKEAMYGADLPGSLFPPDVEQWNVACLPGPLSHLQKKIPGVNTPYLYFGSWKATFAWHVEDMDLFSINYLHFGAPKHWYSIQTAHRDDFENFAKSKMHHFCRNSTTTYNWAKPKFCIAKVTTIAASSIVISFIRTVANIKLLSLLLASSSWTAVFYFYVCILILP